jgi:hypothetical protein
LIKKLEFNKTRKMKVIPKKEINPGEENDFVLSKVKVYYY